MPANFSVCSTEIPTLTVLSLISSFSLGESKPALVASANGIKASVPSEETTVPLAGAAV